MYVSYRHGVVGIYQYPGRQQVGELTGFGLPLELCADAGGDVYVVDYGNDEVFEYAHGGTSPIRTLSVSGGDPLACSVDPTSGNVAVTVPSNGSYGGYVAVYPPTGSGNPQPYVAPNVYEPYNCAYDKVGNLYVDGTGNYNVALAGLAHGAYGMVAIVPNVSFTFAGPMQWDGKFLAMQDAYSEVIYRLAIDWTYDQALNVGSVDLAGVNQFGDLAGWWIQGRRLVAPLQFNNIVEYWEYPSGAAQKYFNGLGGEGTSATVSKAPR